MVLHLSAAAHHIPSGRIIDTVTGPSCYVHGLQDVNVIAGHLSVAYQETGCRQGSQAAAYDISVLLIHTLGLPGSCKSFIVSVGIINALAVLIKSAKFCIAVIQICIGLLPANTFVCTLCCFLTCLFMVLCCQRSSCSRCRHCRHTESDTFPVCHKYAPPFLMPADADSFIMKGPPPCVFITRYGYHIHSSRFFQFTKEAE